MSGMVYVALLRGINVGGNRTVEMAMLKQTFEQLGFTSVRTFISSGNVIFSADSTDRAQLTAQLEDAIAHNFGFPVPVLLGDLTEMAALAKGIPGAWVNNDIMRCDVMFLWPAIDGPEILERIPHRPDVEDLLYLPGAVIWRVDRDKVRRGQVLQISGDKLHKQITVRNPNTVRKLYELMLAADKA